jgi:hypothetical protein
MDPSVIPKQVMKRSLLDAAQMSSPKVFSYTLCCCGTGLSGASAIVNTSKLYGQVGSFLQELGSLAAVFTVVDLDKIRFSHLEE